MITAEEARAITDKARDREKQQNQAKVNSYVETLSARVAKAAGKGEKHVPVYFNLPLTLWDKVYWRMTQAGYAVYYRQNTNEIDIWW